MKSLVESDSKKPCWIGRGNTIGSRLAFAASRRAAGDAPELDSTTTGSRLVLNAIAEGSIGVWSRVRKSGNRRAISLRGERIRSVASNERDTSVLSAYLL